MFKLWLDFIRAQQVAFYMTQIDSTSFMGWKESGIAGIANLPGV